jgi:transglutaminase-like putative cysteine protease
MTRFLVRHRTEYRYDEPVTAGHTVTRLEPRPLDHQRVLRTGMDVEPEPSGHSRYVDQFGNHVTYLAFDAPHTVLAVTATSEVELGEWVPFAPPAWGRRWEDAVEATAHDGSDDGLLARACRLDSPLVRRHPDLAAFAAASFTPGRPFAEAASELTGRIFADFEFVAGATDVTTPVLEVLARRRGVCQDFAHLLLGALRSLGLGARYVSGYIETGNGDAGTPGLVGAEASHAWVALYVPGTGWVDLDPTNGLVHPDRHVTVAWGRDYTDVAPVRGVVVGPPVHQDLTITVTVRPLDEALSA